MIAQKPKSSKYEKIILLLESAILVLLIANIFRGCYSTYISSQYMIEHSASGLVNAYCDNGSTYIYTENNDGEIIFTYEFGKLECGAYDISVEYFADYYYQTDIEMETSAELNKAVGNIDIYSLDVPSAVSASDIILKDGSQKMNSTFWISPGFRLRDLRLDASFWGTGQLGIKSIEINEKREYRVIYLFEYLLIVLLTNLIYLICKKLLYSKNKWIILSLLLIWGLSCLPMRLNAGVIGHDSQYHLARLVALSEGIANGQFPNRIEQSMLNGYGYIGSLFYGEIFLYIPALLILLGVKVQTAYCLYIILINLLTILIVNYCCRKMFQDSRIAILGSIIYTYAPYRYMDIFFRAALGEFTAWAFCPLVVYGFWIIYSKDKSDKVKIGDCWPLILGASGIIQSHVLSCEMMVLFVAIFCLVCWKKTFSKNILVALIKNLIVIVLMNIWFLYPFISSMKMHLNVFNEMPELIGKRGLELVNILLVFPVQNMDYRYFLGATFVIGIAIFAYCIFNHATWRMNEDTVYRIGVISFSFSFISILLTLRCFPYDRISSFSSIISKVVCMIQFPWRFLMFASLFGTFTICATFRIISKKECVKKWYFGFQGVLAIILLILVSARFSYDEANLAYTKNDVDMNNIGNAEYLLVGSDIDKITDKSVIATNGIENSELRFDKGIYSININNNSDSMGTVLLPIFNYDNYTAFDTNGNVIEHENGDNNQILLNVPAGFHGTILLKYSVPASWRLCEIISLVIIIGLFVIMIQGSGILKCKRSNVSTFQS